MESVEDCRNEPSISQTEDVKIEYAEENASPDVIPGYNNIDDFLQEAYDKIRTGIRAANSLPTGDNFKYYTCFPSFKDNRNKSVNRILATMQTIIKLAGGSSNIEHQDIDDRFDVLLDVNDLLLDRTNICMDEESGIKQKPEVQLVVTQMFKPAVNGSWNAKAHQPAETLEASQNIKLLGGKNVQRPQLMFKDKIDNSFKPWQPRIKEKPNSLKPLALYLEEDQNGEVFNHPYEFELNRFEVPECQLQRREPVKYKLLEDTQLIYIDTISDIKILLEDLKNYNEIAVDLEHHSYRTFLGITCLMQISTADTDYIIDTLTLRSELHQLNEIFTKPTILKVFHGADSDIQWLQRDLSLYIVNMFDTHQAAKQLNLPYLSLAYLLKKFCEMDPNKHFQLADWRIRPLPEELMKYAREDTHYLLYIKDMLKNELIEAANGQSNILKAVYNQSTEICKRRYVKPIWTEANCMNLYRKNQKMFNNKQMYAYKELHKWRDQIAREEDDSIGYVLPNHMLFNIAETLPREMQGILACCNPIPPLVRQNVLKLHKIVLKAREQPFIKSSIPEDDFRQRRTQQNHAVNSEAWKYSPHDIPTGMEARADLPCLLDKDGTTRSVSVANATIQHTVTIFDTPNVSEDEGTESNVKKYVFIDPYTRYKCVLPIIVEEEVKQLEKQQKAEKEKCLDEANNKKNVQQIEINESINRVYEHFKQVSQSQSLNKEQGSSKKKKKKKKNSTLFLGQMHGKKRKKESNTTEENKNQVTSNDRLSIPTSSLDARIIYITKNMKQKMQNMVKKQNLQSKPTESFAYVQEGRHSKEIKSIRSRKKGEKKANAQLLKQHGMLPSEKFDYKTVDFGSFQGGSTMNSANQVLFQPPKQKKNEKYRKWKKQKLNV